MSKFIKGLAAVAFMVVIFSAAAEARGGHGGGHGGSHFGGHGGGWHGGGGFRGGGWGGPYFGWGYYPGPYYYYAGPPGCGWVGVRSWRYNHWVIRRTWRCW